MQKGGGGGGGGRMKDIDNFKTFSPKYYEA